MVRLSDYVRLLRGNSDFARLWAAQVISWIGDWFNTIVLSALVASYSSNPGMAVSGFFLAQLLPPMLFSARRCAGRPLRAKRLLIFSDGTDGHRAAVRAGCGRARPVMAALCLTIAHSCVGHLNRSQRGVPACCDRKRFAESLSSSTWSAVLAVGYHRRRGRNNDRDHGALVVDAHHSHCLPR
jgi:hypothetical protein